ncbi:F-box domain containing protein [Diplocarpon rosae]|nr:F-box domain containing protein [Diplocarpon rosae]
MAPKRRRSVASTDDLLLLRKRTCVDDAHSRLQSSCDRLSVLSDELLIRILHLLPLPNLLRGHLVSRRFYRLSTDSQIWKNLYYDRFVLPRALRIPGIKNVPSREEALVFSSRRSKWLGEEGLVNRDDGKRTDWKGRFRLRHNWSRGVCEVREIRLKEERSAGMLVRMADGVVLTVDVEDGVRAWDLKGKGLIAQASLEIGDIPTCLAVDEQHINGILGVAVGFEDGGWQTWKLNVQETVFAEGYRHPSSSNGRLSAVAFAHPYLLTITQGQLLSLYSFSNFALEEEMLDSRPPAYFRKGSKHTPSSESLVQDDVLPHVGGTDLLEPVIIDQASHPRLLASLKSHTSWPPLSLSIRTTATTLIASIAYTLRTYTSGYTVGLQELHLSLTTGSVIFSRLTSALPQGFTSILPPSSSSTPLPSTSPDRIGARGENSRPTTLSYSHPYILATHPDNTLTLYLCTSTASTLTITPGTKLWGHTSSVSSAEITPRGKAVSVSTRGNELRVWELEGGLGSSLSGCNASLRRAKMGVDRSVRVRTSSSTDEATIRDWETVRDLAIEAYEEEVEVSKQWVGFDEELVIVLKESGSLGRKALTVYDFT